MRVAILETGRPPGDLGARFGAYPAMFERLLQLGPTSSYAVMDGQLPTHPEDHDAYIVTGSPAGVYDPLPWIDPLMGFLRRSRDKATLVGICFGHQVMAQAFGGQVIKSPKGWGVGLHEYQVVRREPWMDGAPSFAIPASHQDQVVVRPPDAAVIAASEFTPFAGLAYSDKAISFQGHPEFEPPFAQALLHERRGTRLSVEVADAAIASLVTPQKYAAQIVHPQG